MNKFKSLIFTTFLVLFISSLQGCTSYEPVSAKECKSVVKHAQKVLGKLSPSYTELLKSCKAANDDKRGCIMAAKKVGQMAQCN